MSTSQFQSTASNSVMIPFGEWREVCLTQKDHAKKDELRSESRRLFSSLVQATQVETESIILTTKSSHNEALAQLIHELGPALLMSASGGTHLSRIWALYCFCGAVEGCSKVGLSHHVVNLLGSFLVRHCGPLEEDDDDLDEVVRDAAILCLTSLVRTTVDASRKEGLVLRLDLTRQGVQRRCAAPDLEEDFDDDQGYDFPQKSSPTDIRGGLSTLSRSRRDLCFGLILACIEGIASASLDSKTIDFDLTTELSSFSVFVSTCLHGESDPRCLQQLLSILRALQIAFLPYYESATGKDRQFPILNVFDAVAPYYPVQFTPPPNDNHGITRQSLHSALMQVLTYTAFDSLIGGRDTMLNLSAGIFLERIVPTEGEESTIEDKKDGIDDMTELLFGVESKWCAQLHDDIIRELSVTLMSLHAEAAASVSGGGANGKRSKTLADSCRALVSNVAADLESCKDESSWAIFVSDVVRENSSTLSTSPQTIHGRTTVAYLACLAASGGPKTLNVCLQNALPRLIDAIVIDSCDEEKIGAAVYGLAAFYSAFRVCHERGSKAGVAFHPHPLRDFMPLKALIPLMDDTKSTPSTKVAVIRAMDAVLSVTPLEFISNDDFKSIHSFLECLANTVTSFEATQTETELLTAASRTLGSLMGRYCEQLVGENGLTTPLALHHEDTGQFMNDVIYQKILSHATNKDLKVSPYALLTLALTCAESMDVAQSIVGTLANSLVESLKATGTSQQSKSAAASLSFILQRGGHNAITAFHHAKDQDSSSIQIVQLLVSQWDRESTNINPSRALGRGMSTLELPSTEEERKIISESLHSTFAIIPYLRPGFDTDLVGSPLPELAARVEQLLPPLSDAQNAQLCVALPFLSTGLSRRTPLSSELQTKLNALFQNLLEFALSKDNYITARAAAASCLHNILITCQPNPSEDILFDTWESSFYPALKLSVGKPDEFGECLSLAAMLGGAAAIRGKASIKAADAILELLVSIACTGTTSIPLSSEKLDIAKIDNPTERTQHHLRAASAFGMMLAMEGPGEFWKQRLLHKANKSFREQGTSIPFVESVDFPSPQGRLALLCHIILVSPINSLKQSVVENYSEQLISSLQLSFPKPSDSGFLQLQFDRDTLSLKELHLTAVLKFIACYPNMVSRYIPLLVTTFLRVFSDTSAEDRAHDLPIQLLALQGLLNATSVEESRQHLLVMKPAVASILSVYLDHPLLALRQAVVTTNNKWAVLK